ncbi:MAG: transglutaminase domain-containing protein, partial [Bacillota bacterium]|nr:transglutaminase domain-containing protein [Bacillota bacterium]
MSIYGEKAILCWLVCLFFLFCAWGCTENKTAGTRDNTPVVLSESPDGSVVYGNDAVAIDASNSDEGYIMVKYLGDNSKVRLQISSGDETVYTYILADSGDYETFPLTEGDGSYTVSVYENISGDKYAQAYSTAMEVRLKDEFRPFLHSNQYIKFNSQS